MPGTSAHPDPAQIFQSLIMRIQANSVDENGTVPDEVRKGLLDTLDRYGKWQTTAKNLREPSRGTRQ